jgi:hypothetical protein
MTKSVLLITLASAMVLSGDWLLPAGRGQPQYERFAQAKPDGDRRPGMPGGLPGRADQTDEASPRPSKRALTAPEKKSVGESPSKSKEKAPEGAKGDPPK